jgi:ATP-dependent Clp protease ATP-binding subunit ClpA
VFERYTEAARRTILFARVRAGALGAERIEPEHLLLGLIIADPTLLEHVLENPAGPELIKNEVESGLPAGERVGATVEIALSASSRRILQFANGAADRMKHYEVDTIHVLLGLLKNSDSAAARALERHHKE